MKKIDNGSAYRSGWLSLIGNILLFAVKFWAGLVSGSIALIADAWHTLSDSLSSLVVLISVKISEKPADDEHPYGHGRAEWIGSLLVAMLLAVIAFSFIRESVERLQSRQEAHYGAIAIIVTIVSILVKEAMAQYAFYAGKKTNTRSLKADAWHHRSDAISSVVILAGIFLGRYFWWIDAILGVIVGMMLLWVTWGIMRDTSNAILGVRADEKLENSVMGIARSHTEFDIRPHDIRLHDYGMYREMTLHIQLPPDMTLLYAHEIASIIEQEIMDQLSIETIIHMEPYGL